MTIPKHAFPFSFLLLRISIKLLPSIMLFISVLFHKYLKKLPYPMQSCFHPEKKPKKFEYNEFLKLSFCNLH